MVAKSAKELPLPQLPVEMSQHSESDESENEYEYQTPEKQTTYQLDTRQNTCHRSEHSNSPTLSEEAEFTPEREISLLEFLEELAISNYYEEINNNSSFASEQFTNCPEYESIPSTMECNSIYSNEYNSYQYLNPNDLAPYLESLGSESQEVISQAYHEIYSSIAESYESTDSSQSQITSSGDLYYATRSLPKPTSFQTGNLRMQRHISEPADVCIASSSPSGPEYLVPKIKCSAESRKNSSNFDRKHLMRKPLRSKPMSVGPKASPRTTTYEKHGHSKQAPSTHVLLRNVPQTSKLASKAEIKPQLKKVLLWNESSL